MIDIYFAASYIVILLVLRECKFLYFQTTVLREDGPILSEYVVIGINPGTGWQFKYGRV